MRIGNTLSIQSKKGGSMPADETMIPLYKPHVPKGLGSRIEEVLSSGQIAGGPDVSRFEELLRDYLGNPWVTTTSDISTALTLSLFMSGVGPGDDVLMSPLVCLSTSCPVRNLFANVRWCDVDPMTGNIDPKCIEKRITPRTKAIVVYHWVGNPAELDSIHAIARSHNIRVIEDAGEALGAEYHGKKIGATGSDFTVFSFYPNRHLTTIEGGAIACAREDDYEKLRWLKRYGIHQPSFRDQDGEINQASDITLAGWNSYMNNVAAIVGIAQMDHLEEAIARHQQNGAYYDEVLANISGVSLLNRPFTSRSSYWVYTFLAENRDALLKHLRKKGISASKVHLRNDVYTCFGTAGENLSGVDVFSARSLSIPCGWWVSVADKERIIHAIQQGVKL